MQAYDAVALETDVQVGATEQLFNLMAGRTLQRAYGQRPQIAICMPILVGTDGQPAHVEEPGQLHRPQRPAGGDVRQGDVAARRRDDRLLHAGDATCRRRRSRRYGGSSTSRSVNPMEMKKRLAREIVTDIHGAEAAQEAERAVRRTFQQGEIPEDVVEYRMSLRTDHKVVIQRTDSYRRRRPSPSRQVDRLGLSRERAVRRRCRSSKSRGADG